MIYFLLPIYNEAKNLRELINEIRQLLLGQESKIVAINDGSTDSSLDVLNELGNKDLLIESHRINMNIGAVFSAGILRILQDSKNPNDIVIIMESDQTSSLNEINDLLHEINEKNKDVVIASRYRKGGGYHHFPIFRNIFSRCANKLLSNFFPINDVKDYTIFFRAYRISALRKAAGYFGKFGLIQSRGFAANAELLIKLSFFTNQISEVPFVYDYSKKKSRSKIKILSTINETIMLIGYLKEIYHKLEKFRATK